MTKKRTSIPPVPASAPVETAFAEVVGLIQAARGRTWQAVNAELIDLYWRIGEYLHHRIAADGWAQGTVVQLAAYFAQREPGVRGFSTQNLWRMRQFFEAYRDEPILSSLLRGCSQNNCTALCFVSSNSSEATDGKGQHDSR